MNWYKTALKIQNLNERNLINKKIIILKNIIAELNYLIKYVFQNASDAKKRISVILNSKHLSSYIGVKKLLELAESKSLDNYKATSDICKDIVSELFIRLTDLEKERRRFVEKESPKMLTKYRERYS